MEPEAQEALEQWNAGMRDGATLDVTATNGGSLLSIAISLKRIADALTYTAGPENLFDLLSSIRHDVRSVQR